MDIFLKKKNVLWQRVLVGGITLVVFLVVLNFFSAPIKNSVYDVASPFANALTRLGSGSASFFGSFFQAQTLAQKNNALTKQNQLLLSQVSSLQEIIAQNQSATEALENIPDTTKLLQAQVIGLDTSLDYVLINKGSKDGIQENMPVISAENVLYGKIDKVYGNFSQVMLVSSKSSVLDAEVQSSEASANPVYGAIKGKGNLGLYLDLVPSNDQLQQGDVLVTSGLEGIFPKDLLVGKISSKDQNDLKPFQTAQVQPFLATNNLDSLFVITNYKQEK